MNSAKSHFHVQIENRIDQIVSENSNPCPLRPPLEFNLQVDLQAELQTDQSSGSFVQLSPAGYHKAKEEHGPVAVRHTPGLKHGPVAQRTYCAQVSRYPVQQVDGKLGPKRHVIGAEVARATESETTLRIEAPGDCP